jgi:hypothetical protein
MQREMHQAMMMGQHSISPYFVLRVSRERIVLDTLSQILLYSDNEFKKPLKVVFDDEEGKFIDLSVPLVMPVFSVCFDVKYSENKFCNPLPLNLFN